MSVNKYNTNTDSLERIAGNGFADIDVSPISGSVKPITSGGVYTVKNTIDNKIGDTDISDIGDGTLSGAVDTIDSKLSVVGNKYATTTLVTSSVPATTQTIVLQLSNLPIGVYVAVGKIGGSTTTTNGGLIEMAVSSGESVSTSIQNTGFYINGTISNVFEVTSETNTVDVRVFTTDTQTITSGRLTVVRIA